jgi:hypothetical protein
MGVMDLVLQLLHKYQAVVAVAMAVVLLAAMLHLQQAAQVAITLMALVVEQLIMRQEQ